jgi:DUF1009 family protein
MTAMQDRRRELVAQHGEPIAIVCGAGSLPFTVSEAAMKQGRKVLLFALRGWADPQRVAAYPHQWIRLGAYGRFRRLARAAGCRDVVLIGSLTRPTIPQLWPDFGTLMILPRLARLFKGGDDHLLSGLGDILHEDGFHLLGPHEIAPSITMPKGMLGRSQPNDRDRADIARGLALLRATGPFDVGQAVVVADQRVLAVEAAGGTDEMLLHLAELRQRGRVRSPANVGVLVKAPKPEQDQRVDLPSIGPQTVEHAARAGLAGVAVVAGSVVVAEPDRIASAADRAGIFVAGVGADGTV